MRYSKFSRAVCLTLAALLILLCGCGAKPAPTAEPTPTVIVASNDADSTPAPELLASRAFQKHYYKLPGTLTDVSDVCADAQYLYLLGTDEADSSHMQLWRMGLDGSGETQLHTFYEIQNESAWQYHSHLLPRADGGVYVRETEGVEAFVFPEGITAESAGQDRWDYYDHTDITTRLYAFSGDGKAPTTTTVYSGKETIGDLVAVGENLAFCVDKTISILAADGKRLASHVGDFAVYGLAASGGDLYAITASADYESSDIRKVDLATGELSEPLTVLFSPFLNSVGVLDGGVVTQFSGDLFLYQPETNETRKLVDWIDYGVNPFDIGKTFASESAIVAVQLTYRGDATLLVLMPSNTTVLPASSLTLGVPYPDEEIVAAVIAFNQSGRDRIRLVDYSEYDLFEQNSQARMAEDVASDRCPDLLYSASADSPADQFGAKRLIDLLPLVEADGELTGEGLVSNVIALLQDGGKLPVLSSYFYLRTAIGRESVLGSAPLTLETTARLAAGLPENGSICDFYMTRDSVFTDLFSQISDSLRTDDGSYRFSSQLFYDSLAYAKLFPAEVDWNSFDYPDYSGWMRVRRGDQLTVSEVYTGFSTLTTTLNSVGSDGVICGLPAVPSGSAVVFPTSFGITTACNDVDLAWRFARTMMLASYQQQLPGGFPTNRAALDALGQAALASEDTALYSSAELTIEVPCRPTAQQYDAILAAIGSASAREHYDATASDAILPSVMKYFTGELDAPRAALAAQSAWDEIATTPR